MKKILMIIVYCMSIVVGLVLLLTGILFFMKNQYLPKTILKTAVKEKNLSNRRYILCKERRVTGFDWMVIKDENGEETFEECNIIGSTPNEFGLSYEFAMMDNTFVFYIEEKTTYRSNEIGVDVTEYIAWEWDVLYPVKHDPFSNPFASKKYITEKDLTKREH